MTQSFYRKWRPHRWEEVVGQEHVITTLRNAVAGGRIAHAYLFAGPRGTGKTTTARLLAKAANCLEQELEGRPCDRCQHCLAVKGGRFLDLIEIDAASNTSVEDVRDLRDKINFSPNQGRYKVYIIDEVHMLSTAAFNALLKTLEEPPAHAIFILATTEPHKIPATVHSRCQRHEFRRIPVGDIVAHLKGMAASEDIQIAPEALTLIARQSTGSLRDAVSLLDQLASSGRSISLERAQLVLGTAASQAVLEVIEALLARDPARGLDHLHQALDGGSDPRQFARQIVDYLRNLLLVQMGNASQVDGSAEVLAVMARHAQAFDPAGLLGAIRAFNYAANEARGAWQPALPLEMAFVETLQLPEEDRSRVRVETTPKEKATPTSATPVPKLRLRKENPAPGADDPAEMEAVSPEDSSEEADAMQTLVKNWPQVLKLVRRQNPNTYGLLNSCKTRQLKGSVLVLGFASEVLKNQMDKKENQEIVQRALAEALGVEVSINCIISNAKGTSIPEDVDSDGMVASALRDLGGEIVDVQ